MSYSKSLSQLFGHHGELIFILILEEERDALSRYLFLHPDLGLDKGGVNVMPELLKFTIV